MNRSELAQARARHPDLTPVWQNRIQRLQQERDRIVNTLHVGIETPRGAETDRATSYRAVIRLDRSLSFLDRALLHLDDLDHEASNALPIPLALHPERYQ